VEKIRPGVLRQRALVISPARELEAGSDNMLVQHLDHTSYGTRNV
jgi:hypothetical protein